MKTLKRIAYILYLLLSFGLFTMLYLMRNKHGWGIIQGREMLSWVMIGITIAFVLIMGNTIIKSRSRRTLTRGLFGLLPIIISIPFFNPPAFLNKNELTGKTVTIELTYIAWACECANWAELNDLKNHADNANDTLAELSIFIEPADYSLELSDTLGYSNDIIKFTGQFYKNIGFPKDYDPYQDVEPARVFRYTKYEVVKSNYTEYRERLLNAKQSNLKKQKN